jgi:DNA-binding phage protein
MATTTQPYDVAESPPTPEEIAVYLKACNEEADGGASFIARASWDTALVLRA